MRATRIRRVVLVAAVLATGSHALAQLNTPVFGGERLAAFWDACRTGRADVLCIGDSNQLHRGAGWDDAVAHVLSEEFGLYATGLHPLGENEGLGAGVGIGSSTLNTGSASGYAYSGAPPSAASRLDTETSLLAPLNYLFIPEGIAATGSTASGLILAPESPLGISGPLRFHITFAAFAGPGPGSFEPALRLQSDPPVELARLAPVPTRGTESLAHIALDLPASPRSDQVTLRLAADAQSAVVGPFVGYFARVERVDRTRGVSVHTLYGKGGQSARDMALALQSASDQTLITVLTEATALQTGNRRALIRICTGLNDRAETLDSIGPEPQGPPTSPGAYADNLHALLNRLNEAWALAGFDPANLYFVITPSHPVPGDDDAMLKLYRPVAEDVARNHERAASVDLSKLVTSEELIKNSWYVTQGDFNHLRLDGMRELARRELVALLEASKP